MSTFAIGSFGITEIVVIGLIILLLFGARKLPELARSLGSSITEFKKGMKSEDESKKQP